MKNSTDNILESVLAKHLRVEAARDQIQVRFRTFEGQLYCQVAKHWYKAENALNAIQDLQGRLAPSTEVRS